MSGEVVPPKGEGVLQMEDVALDLEGYEGGAGTLILHLVLDESA